MTFLGWLSDPFKGLSDLQLGDVKGTLNHLVVQISFLKWPLFLGESIREYSGEYTFQEGIPIHKPWPGQSIRINGHGFSILGIPWSRRAKTIERIVYPGIVDEVNPY